MTSVRTTIVLPKEDYRNLKILAATHGMTMSDVVKKSIQHFPVIIEKEKKIKKAKVGWRAFAGSMNLGGKEPPTRAQLYEDYFNEKNSR